MSASGTIEASDATGPGQSSPTEGIPTGEQEPSREAGDALGSEAGDTPSLERTIEALLFLAPDPLSEPELAEATEAGAEDVRAALAELAEQYAAGPARDHAARAGRRLDAGERPRGRGRRPAPVQPQAHRDAHPRAGGDAGDRRLPAADLAPGDHAHPRRQRRLGDRDAARARPDRGGRALAVRRGALPHGHAVPEAVRPAHARRPPRRRPLGPTPEEQATLRERLLRAGEARAGGGPRG